MSEMRIEAKCKCGRTIVKILNSERPTMWRNGDRYTYPDRDDGWCVFRCDRCHTIVDELFPKSIPNAPIKTTEEAKL